jgi:hypothetical protein
VCFGGGGGTPAVVQPTPIADDSKARDKAGQDAIAARKRRKQLSLIASGAQGDATGNGLGSTPTLTAGKTTLGA